MKKTHILIPLAIAVVAFFASCKPKTDAEGFYTAESGLKYKFVEQTKDKDAPLVQMDDLLEGEMAIVFNGDTLFSNYGHPEVITRVEDDWFQGGHNEAFLMMHEGDHALFGISADSIAKFLEPSQMPRGYKPNSDMRIIYDVHLIHILTKEDIAKREAKFMEEMEKKKDDEHSLIEQYVEDNGITAKPLDNGMYVVVTKQGSGKKAVSGSTVSVMYAGRLLNGKLFDTNIESLASELGRPGGHYQPFAFTLGQNSVIPGWEQGILGLRQGSKATLVIPSSLAYGASGAGRDIPPYSPLVFDVEIVNVN